VAELVQQEARRVRPASHKRVLVVEDNPGDARLLHEMFDEEGSHDTELTCVTRMSAAEKHLRERAVDVVLLDLGLPNARGLGAVRQATRGRSLRRFSIDALKIDQSFVREISTEGNNPAIVNAVISMAKSLKLKVVAEGVETREQLNFLRAHHCDEAQGYYFRPPVPPKQFAKLLEEGVEESRLFAHESSVDTVGSGVHRKLSSTAPAGRWQSGGTPGDGP
jgi:CheY-like chemotaxis protein